MSYRFMGEVREQLWFSSPNIAACFLVMIALFMFGVFLSLVNRKNFFPQILSLLPASLSVSALLMLVCTYSRGGYMALFFSFIIMYFLSRSKWIFCWSGCFVIFLIFIENGIARVGTSVQLSEGSILHRLLLWRGSMALLADNWLSGMGLSYNIGWAYTTWYQPLWLDEAYSHTLNDFLMLSCGWGIFASGSILLIVCIILFWGWQTQQRIHSGILCGIIATVFAFMVCGSFSAMYINHSLLCMFVGALAMIIVYSIVATLQRRISWSWKTLLIPFIVVTIFCVLFIWSSKIIRSYFPYKFTSFLVDDISIIIAEPDLIKHRIIVVANKGPLWRSDEEDVNLIRNTVRELLERNCKVYFSKVDSGINGLNDAAKLLDFVLKDKGNMPVIILAYGFAGKQLYIASAKNKSSQISRVLVYDIDDTWPFEELSSVCFAKEQLHPVTFIRKVNTFPGQLQNEMKRNNQEIDEIIIESDSLLFDVIELNY